MKRLYIMAFFILKTIISKSGVKDKPEINAYYLISLCQGINLLSIYNILRTIYKSIDNLSLSFFIHVLIFFVPPILMNYLFFIRSERYTVLIKEISDKPISPKWSFIFVMTYLVFTIFFYAFSNWVNV